MTINNVANSKLGAIYHMDIATPKHIQASTQVRNTVNIKGSNFQNGRLVMTSFVLAWSHSSGNGHMYQ